jgi:sortase A
VKVVPAARTLSYRGAVARSALLTAAVLTAGSLVSGSEAPGAPPSASPPSASSSPTPGSDTSETPIPRLTVSDGRPRRARLSIPALGLHALAVVPYRGRTDDAAGTRIQDGGVAASPYGPRGGVGPGGLGNYQITAHRTSSTQAFRMLPSLRAGQRAVVEAGFVRYVYEIRRTRETSFRSPRSLAAQRAAVPGRMGVLPTRAFLTLTTCATPEDHAEGNYWADELSNPEHRIDKIGVLVRTANAD